MINTENLENIILKCGITRVVTQLPNPIYGYYYSDADDYIILINQSILANSRLYRTVLAEEIGHHMTTIGDITPRKYMCYRDRLTIDKQELKAIRWAADFLIPTRSLLGNIRENKTASLLQLEDHFMVTQELLMQKLEFMSKQNGIWDLDGKTALYLYNFPSVYIYEKI